jgi:hypothetical protein
MRPTAGSEPVREAQEIGLVHSAQDLGYCALDDLVFERRNTEVSLPTIGFWDNHAADRPRPVSPRVDALVQCSQVILQVLFIARHRFPVHAWRRFPL